MGSMKLIATLVPRGPAAAVVLDDEQAAAIGEGAKLFELDTEPRKVELPEALGSALAAAPSRKQWIRPSR
jgi:hypothetical protein